MLQRSYFDDEYSSPVKESFSDTTSGDSEDDAISPRHLIIVNYNYEENWTSTSSSSTDTFGWENFSPPMRDATSSTSSTIDIQDCDAKSLPRAVARKLQQCPCSPGDDSDGVVAKKKKKVNPAKSVSFSNLAIREHGIILGDHPCAKTLPISLGWEHTAEPTVHEVDAYERMREGRRRRGDGIRMSYVEKRNLLREHGLSEAEINRAHRHSILHRQAVPAIDSVSSKIRRVQTLAALQQSETE